MNRKAEILQLKEDLAEAVKVIGELKFNLNRHLRNYTKTIEPKYKIDTEVYYRETIQTPFVYGFLFCTKMRYTEIEHFGIILDIGTGGIEHQYFIKNERCDVEKVTESIITGIKEKDK